jgi:hypothetical protein
MEADQRQLIAGLSPLPSYWRCEMYSTIMVIILLFPWSILGIMLAGAFCRRLRKVPVRSR